MKKTVYEARMNENTLEELVAVLMKENDGFNPNSLMAREQQLEQKRLEYRRLLTMEPLQKKMEIAIALIAEQLPKRITQEEYDSLQMELYLASDVLKESPATTGEALGITKPVLDALFVLGQEQLDKQKFTEAAAIFTLLTVLDSSWYRHWFCLGVAEQQNGEYDEAIKAYEVATMIAPNDPKTHFLAAECYLAKSSIQEALLQLEAAKKIMDNQPPDADWQSQYAYLEVLVKQHHIQRGKI